MDYPTVGIGSNTEITIPEVSKTIPQAAGPHPGHHAGVVDVGLRIWKAMKTTLFNSNNYKCISGVDWIGNVDSINSVNINNWKDVSFILCHSIHCAIKSFQSHFVLF